MLPTMLYTLAVLIASYERLRNLVSEIGETEVGLLLADEGHRLKNYSERIRRGEDKPHRPIRTDH